MTKTWSRCGTPLGTFPSLAIAGPTSVAANKLAARAFPVILIFILFPLFLCELGCKARELAPEPDRVWRPCSIPSQSFCSNRGAGRSGLALRQERRIVKE